MSQSTSDNAMLPIALNNKIGRSAAPVWSVLAVTMFHVVVLSVGFFILIAVFDFPDVLREPAADRLAKFMAEFSVIVPTYYLLALTGLSQAMLAVLIWLCVPRRDETAIVIASLFGMLCGVFQALGFIRWAIVIPYIANQFAAAETPEIQSTVIMLEGLINRYAGMAVGEHLGFLTMGLWTLFLGIAALNQRFIDRRLGWVGIVLGLVTIAMAMEPLGGPFVALGELTAGVMGTWSVWLVLIAVSLIRSRRGDANSIPLPLWIWGIALVVTLSSTVPAYL